MPDAAAEDVAVLCPGHGGEHRAMRARVADHRPDLLELAQELVGDDPFERLRDGTIYAQPAILCASLAAWATAKDEVEPVAIAGHSLGEFSALVVAGALSADDALRLVVVRGEACQRAADASPGGMTILGVSAERAAELAADHGLEVVNDNAPNQAVVAGPVCRLAALERSARDLGLAAKRLGTAAPFHTEAMRSAAKTLAKALASVDVSSPSCPVISAASAKPFIDVRAELAQALVRPVRWRAVNLALGDLGASRFLDLGPGRILSRLAALILGVTATSSLEDRFP